MSPHPARRVRRALRDGWPDRPRGLSVTLLALVGVAALPLLVAADGAPDAGHRLVDHVRTVAVAQSLREGARAAKVAVAVPNSVTVPNPVPLDAFATILASRPKPPPPPPPPPPPAPPAPAPSGGIWAELAQCESGGNWASTKGMFEGGLQFSNGTWLSFGGGAYAQHAYEATPSQQIAIAEKVLRAAGGRYTDWPGCRAHLGLA
jgi:hypothetical protein